jgi:1-deoxy-D-xylulose-5-phosphate reductoisomerase
MKSIAILGSTGSIGRQALDIVAAHPDKLTVTALAAGSGNLDLLSQQIAQFRPSVIAVPDDDTGKSLRSRITGTCPEIVVGQNGLTEVAVHSEVNTVLTAVVGFKGVIPTAAAIEAGKQIALANKETLVAAGSIIMPLAHRHGVKIVPVDSEHSAIFQSLANYANQDIERIWLTGSGGPFRTWTNEQIQKAKIEDALKHPNWSMGRKITIDSATLMNKGLEIIEARWLFDVRADQVKVIIHPQSVLHSAVEFRDGSVVGQMGIPDMRLPIHYALFWPQREPSVVVPRLDLIKLGSLTFEEPDLQKFPCLALAREVADGCDTRACVLNGANEITVDAFLEGQISFGSIAIVLQRVLERHSIVADPALEDILESDRWARAAAVEEIYRVGGQIPHLTQVTGSTKEIR